MEKRHEGIHENNLKLLQRYELICKNKGLTEETIAAFCKYDLPLFLRYIKDIEIKDIDHILVEDFLAYCANERQNSDWALARKYTTINTFFETLYKKEYLPSDFRNPMFKIDQIKIRHRVKDYLTKDEIKQIMNYIEKIGDLRSIALISLLYSSACRLSEIHQLNRSTLDMEKRYFKVKGKGQKERICFFSNDSKIKLEEYLNSRKDDLEPLFISRQKNRWSKRAIQICVKNIGLNAGIKKNVTPHIFRHSILTNLRLSGVELSDLQQLAGHESIQTTQRVYTHVGLEDISAKFDKFHEHL